MGLKNFNASRKQKWNIENKDFPYIKLSQLIAGLEYKMYGFFITKDRGYGEGAVIITDGYNVNVPTRYVEIFREMARDNDAIEEIISGKAVFSFEPYKTRAGRESYILTFNTIE